MKKICVYILCLVIFAGIFSGCSKDLKVNNDTNSKQIKISIGNAPKDNDSKGIETMNVQIQLMREKYPNITVVPDQWVYSVDTFLPKAASGQLPTMYPTYFTETSKIIDAGYACDITDIIKKYGYDKSINEEYLDLITKDGRYYGIPTNSYCMGLACNVNLFRQAGEVDANGIPNFPDTYEEMAQLAKRIKDKTGKAGFFMPTTQNQGGWVFMNIAWSFGTVFEQKIDGKWKATFNSPEGVAALQYIKDLKWKYDVLTTDALVSMQDYVKLFATDQVAMAIDAPVANLNSAIADYQMDRNSIAVCKIPAGPKGRYALLGGNLWMFSKESTSDQIDACFKWLEINGSSIDLTPEMKIALENSVRSEYDRGNIVGCDNLSLWVNPEHVKIEKEIKDKYINVNIYLFKNYMDYTSVKVHSEEPQSCQELYKIFDGVLQTVMIDESADPKTLMDEAASDFQKGYLDKAN